MKKIASRLISVLTGLIIGRLVYDLIFHQEKLQDLKSYISDFHLLMSFLILGSFCTVLLLLVEYFTSKKNNS